MIVSTLILIRESGSRTCAECSLATFGMASSGLLPASAQHFPHPHSSLTDAHVTFSTLFFILVWLCFYLCFVLEDSFEGAPFAIAIYFEDFTGLGALVVPPPPLARPTSGVRVLVCELDAEVRHGF